MKRVLLLSLFVIALASCRKQPATLYILETTDLHGEMGASMASAAGYIEQARKEYGDGLILLDCGDVLQSSPEVCYSDFIDTTSMHIYSQIYNWLQYDAVAVGNHDFGPERVSIKGSIHMLICLSYVLISYIRGATNHSLSHIRFCTGMATR